MIGPGATQPLPLHGLPDRPDLAPIGYLVSIYPPGRLARWSASPTKTCQPTRRGTTSLPKKRAGKRLRWQDPGDGAELWSRGCGKRGSRAALARDPRGSAHDTEAFLVDEDGALVPHRVGHPSRPISRILFPVRPRLTGGDHLSGTRVTARLTQPTRDSEGTSRSLSRAQRPGTRPCLALLSVGFAWPELSPAPPVVSYTAFSPLRKVPASRTPRGILSVALCRRVAPPGR